MLRLEQSVRLHTAFCKLAASVVGNGRDSDTQLRAHCRACVCRLHWKRRFVLQELINTTNSSFTWRNVS